jgi:putative transposase
MADETVRKSPRYPGFDYSTPGGYFITICCRGGRLAFGRIQDGRMQLNPLGRMVDEHWLDIRNHYSNLYLDAHVVMPNHMHALLAILSLNVGGASPAPTTQAGKCGSLASVAGNFKSGVTREARRLLGWRGPLWQRSFHDHVLREPWEAEPIREYIVNNPLSWQLDRENPQRDGDDPFDKWLDEISRRRKSG